MTAAPVTREGPNIPNAGGVALSADGSRAFVHTISTSSAAVYVIPLPINASSNLNPSPYWTSTRSVQYYYIAASVSNSPQLVYLVDNQNGQLVSLAITSPAPTSTSLIYSFGVANEDLVAGMYYQPSSGFLFFSLYDHFAGAAFDYIGWFGPLLFLSFTADAVRHLFDSGPRRHRSVVPLRCTTGR